MGTRGLVGLVVDGKVKASYNHFDSYPSGLGMDVVKFIQTMTDIDTVRVMARRIKMVQEDQRPHDLIDRANLRNLGITDDGGDWYSLLRHAQGDLAEYLRVGYMPDNEAFGGDSLFCEWGYLVNLDDQTLEVYRGFQREPHTAGRWATTPEDRGYYGIAQLDVIPFATLTAEDLKRIEEKAYDE